MANNKRCDVECNTREYNWDNGECCGKYDPDDNQYCIDPNSYYRRYINVDEYKELIGLSNDNSLNVQFADWSAIDLIGLSTFPWEKEVYSNQGGILLLSNVFGSQSQVNNLIHEVGHVLGLWHVHHGVSEVPCGDPCQETLPSMTTVSNITDSCRLNSTVYIIGDLVNDTNPTTKHTQCSDPPDASPCDNRRFTDTPYRNFMSYASGTCSNTFTDQQVARMHCYADLKYENWMQTTAPRRYHIPLGPRIVPLSDPGKPPSIAVKWTSPLGGGNCQPKQSRAWQTHCTADNRIVQYAISATSSGPFQMSGYWGPEQATGPPDAEWCAASTKAWLPDVQSCDDGTDKCTLKVRADIDTQLEKLSVWIAWNAASGVRTIKIIYSDDSFYLFEQVSFPSFFFFPTFITFFSDNYLLGVFSIHLQNTKSAH
ncbi:unnamed protein product [Toxocara canis]|uniref:Peptidase_M43 domain-containing protein n=1 Tax=Toxocara canis TaxID=6265 RepID=A0A183VF10_TOXCA|nr:unnamed protein product [Toxocara canis]